MTKRFIRTITQAISDFERMLYHVTLVSLSGLVAMSLPYLAQGFLALWARIKTDAVLLISAEIAVAVCLTVFFNHVARNREYRRLAKAASGAGLLEFLPAEGHFCEKRLGHLIKSQGLARNVMIIGSTGNSFSEPDRALHAVLKNCLEAKILLLNPCTEEARTRARSIMEPDITSESLRQQVRQSIEFLKLLRAFQKNIKLKLYPDLPTIKLAILGDELWLQHYHTSLDVSAMPLYTFKHNTREHGLYTLFYQHFTMRWENPQIPEYDLETDELVYRAQRSRGATGALPAGPGAPERQGRLAVALVLGHRRRPGSACDPCERAQCPRLGMGALDQLTRYFTILNAVRSSDAARVMHPKIVVSLGFGDLHHETAHQAVHRIQVAADKDMCARTSQKLPLDG